MNMNDFEIIKNILSELCSDYSSLCKLDRIDQKAPITERDIVAEIYSRLKVFCNSQKGLSTHCEIKPSSSEDAKIEELKRLPRIDIAILSDINGRTWTASAMKLQGKYKKGPIESRFSSIPVEFFHTAIEVKIQSNVRDAKKDIEILNKIHNSNKKCNCFFILLNARGDKSDHDAIKEHADKNGICIFEYTCN